jgi:hypothetical protein
MNNFPNPYGQTPAAYNYQQIQQMFPQPQGSVYAINTPTEIGNVPIGSTGLSVAICFNEQLMYIKSFQNGNPVIMAYRVTPYTKEETASTPPAPSSPTIEERMAKLEEILASLTNEGGKFNGLL